MLMPSILGESLFDEFFDDFARPVRSAARHTTPSTSLMNTDVKETKEGYELDIDLPGYKKEDVKAELKNGYLTISAATNSTKENKEEKYLRRERFYGSCSRSFYVGDDIAPKDVSAKFEDGILKITLPKKEQETLPENSTIAIE